MKELTNACYERALAKDPKERWEEWIVTQTNEHGVLDLSSPEVWERMAKDEMLFDAISMRRLVKSSRFSKTERNRLSEVLVEQEEADASLKSNRKKRRKGPKKSKEEVDDESADSGVEASLSLPPHDTAPPPLSPKRITGLSKVQDLTL